MTKFIIIVSVYDKENTQAYPLGGIFDTHIAAERYIENHVDEVKSNHWTRNYTLGDAGYEEEFSIGGSFEALDMFDGASLEIDIHELSDLSGDFNVAVVTRDDLEDKGFDTSELSDEDMERIANSMGNYMLDDIGYWDALVFACERFDIPKKEE